ncbi:MAG: large conductance mechanosensitive channel protein MscL [Myxococcales bacterium]|nr:large conductance mechanosensitive channel protein MscL [Myxococcales bacterium]MCB9733633.1 large conductance mechanosensitive channel protein MscL [Deltaproteobacteria bacterium]
MLKGFKAFILRGNVVDLAVAVIIGGAFGAIVKSLVEDVITPLIGMIVGKPDFSSIIIGGTMGADGKVEGGIMIGNFLNATINFLLVAAAVYFVIVIPMKRIMERKKAEEAAPAPAAPPPPSEEVLLLREIRDNLKKA